MTIPAADALHRHATLVRAGPPDGGRRGRCWRNALMERPSDTLDPRFRRYGSRAVRRRSMRFMASASQPGGDGRVSPATGLKDRLWASMVSHHPKSSPGRSVTGIVVARCVRARRGCTACWRRPPLRLASFETISPVPRPCGRQARFPLTLPRIIGSRARQPRTLTIHPTARELRRTGLLVKLLGTSTTPVLGAQLRRWCERQDPCRLPPVVPVLKVIGWSQRFRAWAVVARRAHMWTCRPARSLPMRG